MIESSGVADHLRYPPFTDHLPAPIFFRIERMPARATYPSLRHDWGEFVYSFSGMTEVRTEAQHFLAPPHLGLWIPPDVEHIGFNNGEAVHCSIYIRRDLCLALPERPCAIIVSALLRAILEQLNNPSGESGSGRAQARLLRVLVDQIASCPTTGSFIPHADSPELEVLLKTLRDFPADNRTTGELAKAFHMTERTLMRRCQKELGMSLIEWRQRMRLVRALPMLRDGHSVESVALDMGYSTSSAFIAMFRRLTGASPAKFASAAS